MARRTKELVIQPEEELNTDSYEPEQYLTDEYYEYSGDPYDAEDQYLPHNEQYPEEDFDPENTGSQGYEPDGYDADSYDAGGYDADGYDADDYDPDDPDAYQPLEEVLGEESEDDEEYPPEENHTHEGGGDDAEQDSGYGLADEDYYDLDEIAEIREKILERKKEQVVRARNAKLRMIAAVVIIITAIAAFIFSLSGFFTVDSIEVKGNSHFTSEEIINIAHAAPGHNLIYDPGKKEITEYLEQNPYISMASVGRKLPSTLVITVKERSENFAFRYDDDYLIMDEDGILLRKSRTKPKLTLVSGMIVNKIKLGQVIGTEKQPVFEKLLELMKEVRKGDLYFVSIDISGMTGGSNNVEAYIYDTLVVKTDYDTLLDAVKTDKLHRIVSKLIELGISRGTIRFNEGGSASYQPAF